MDAYWPIAPSKAVLWVRRRCRRGWLWPVAAILIFVAAEKTSKRTRTGAWAYDFKPPQDFQHSQ